MIKFLLMSLLFLAFLSSPTPAQTSDELTNRSIEETLTRSRIDLAEKRHRKIIASAAELHSLSKQLLRSVESSKLFTEDDQKKLGKIEKLAKQVRSDQGGGDLDEDKVTQPENIMAALTRLEKAAEAIEKESSRITRHGISATLVEQSNEIIYLTKVIKKMRSK